MPMQRKRPLERWREPERQKQRREPGLSDLLWLRLKALEGWHFRKASSFRTFTLPFVEHDALLVVELEADRANRSPVRDRLLHEAGYTILRFPMTDAEAGLDAVMATIRAVLEDRES
jgi:very-short-patch-repair endonuclease